MAILETAIALSTLIGAVAVGGRALFKLILKIAATLDDVRDEQHSQRLHLEAIRQNTYRTGNRVTDLENYLEKTTDFRRRDYGPPD